MPAAGMAAELDSRNLPRGNRSLAMSSFMTIPFQNAECCYTPLGIAKSKTLRGKVLWPCLTLRRGDDASVSHIRGLKYCEVDLVDETGVEPATSSLRTMRSPS